MGILDFLSKEKRHQSKVARNIKRANNKHTPKDYRQGALYEVIDWAKKGDEQALSGMMARFAVNAEPSIEDETEKEWVCEALIEIGRPAMPALKRALRSAESVNWVQRVLENIVSQDEYRDILLNVLSDFDTEYERNCDRKMQTIMALSSIIEEKVAIEIMRFLNDVNETIRFQTVVALSKQENKLTREPLLKTLCEDESIRVRNEAINAFARLGWSTQGFKKKVDQVLIPGFKHEKSGKIVKLGNS